MNKLLVKDLTHTFSTHKNGQLRVLDNVSFSIDESEFIALLGPSGCGKSTLFNIISGLIPPDSGEIYLKGKQINKNTDSFGYMQQKDLLLPWRTVLMNVLIGPEIQKTPIKNAKSEAIKLLTQLGLHGFENSYPSQLSGGMRQRVALVRTLLFRKDFLLLDEPFGSLDAMTRTVMQSILLDIWNKGKQTVLLITHDIEEALLLADKIYVLTCRPTSIKAEVNVNLQRPRNSTHKDYIDLKRQLLEMLTEEMEQVFITN